MSVLEQREELKKAKSLFVNDINDLLIYNQSTKTKYERVYDRDDSAGMIKVYLQRKTRNIVKIFVRETGFGDEPVSLTVDDSDVEESITQLPSFVNMRDLLIEMEESNAQSRLLDKLKHNV